MIKRQKEYEKSYLIKAACDGLVTVKQAAERLRYSEGWVKALKRRYRQIGDAAFVHGNTGRAPANKIPDETRQRIIELKLNDTYKKANFVHFREILEEETGIKVSYTALRNMLIAAGHRSPKTRRTKKQRALYSPRPRRECYGEMLQADSSPFDWFGTGETTALHGFIDDATNTVTGLYMEKNECLLGYLEVTRQTIENHGIPSELYPDKAGVFFVNKKDAQDLTVEEQLDGLTEKKTRLGEIMEELGVDMHPAHTPQAKGRIERLWETLQSRLPVEFKRRGITTIGAANAFLPSFLAAYNAEFAVKPANDKKSFFIRLYDNSLLDTLLTVKIERKTDLNGIFSLHNHKFLIPDPACRGRKVAILMSEKIGFKACAGGKLYDIQYCDFHDNRHIKTHMPDVTKFFIERYLKAEGKETTLSRRSLFLQRPADW